MYKQIVNSVTFVAFVIYSICSSGCTSITRMSIEEVSVTPQKKITRLKLNNSNYVAWNSKGAEYDLTSEKFIGVFSDGSNRFVWEHAVDSVYYISGDNLRESSRSIDEFRSDEGKQRRGALGGDIRGLSDGCKDYEFDRGNGKIDSVNCTVIGVTIEGDSLNMAFNEITNLKVLRFSPGKTKLLVAGVVLLAVFVGAGLAMGDMNFGAY